ncbi:hypothetical protein C2G38_1752446 [Gigaspora rosea]|uniref:Uncharacterized protein n=1 Tax=Gigaspora rosea TaxID=44941 RepID=A0A397V1L0_9GLOM|nr:hypothetical protein C2G38_1752446 [Gigaspora rosea]
MFRKQFSKAVSYVRMFELNHVNGIDSFVKSYVNRNIRYNIHPYFLACKNKYRRRYYIHNQRKRLNPFKQTNRNLNSHPKGSLS